MSLQENIRRILREETESVKCKCGWSWKLSEGGDDPYVCHKCGSDNSDNEPLKEVYSKTERIKSIVSKYGILKSFQMIAGGVETIRQAYNNDPYELLKQYENLTPIEKEYNIEYIDQNGTPIFNYYPVEREVYISNEKIWSVLSIFNLKYDEIQKIISKWLSKNYGINRVYPYLISDINLKKI